MADRVSYFDNYQLKEEVGDGLENYMIPINGHNEMMMVSDGLYHQEKYK
ncbi:MAG: hypothetical protein MRZ79_12695 [Bacteroidia bacterium]|nr:hypothetical protein [Bacteroidia bacterium]